MTSPLFRCAWGTTLFLHYEADPALLAPRVPFPLDLHEGRAYLSVVGIEIRPLGLRKSAPLVAPLRFVNIRTYVRPGGIHFLAAWQGNPLGLLLIRALSGIPYRFGKVRLEPARAEVRTGNGAFRFRLLPEAAFAPCAPGSRDAFLLERYAAFTRPRRRFRVGHAPWSAARARPVIEESLLLATLPWLRSARLAGAHVGAPLDDVRMFPMETPRC